MRTAWIALVACTAACGFLTGRREPPPVDPSTLTVATPSPSPSPSFSWAKDSELAVVIRKRERTLTVYRCGEQQKVYPVVLGIAPRGPKTYQGDLRTPEGVYRMVFKRPHERWSHFILLSYPNGGDIERYAMALTEGRVPIIDGRAPGPGGAVGIHGTDREEANVRGEDWTLGCVSMFNEHVDELYELVPLGTPVLIEE